MRRRSDRGAFTLIELLVAIAIIGLLMAILLPALSGARQRGTAVKCLANLRTLGQGLTAYTTQFGDVLVPGRLPAVDACNWFADIAGGRKFRPTFLAMMGSNIAVSPFDDPMPCSNLTDRFGEPGNRQNYSNPLFVCPSTPNWTDERNGSYGYNYQFLGNSRLSTPADIYSFKNWPVVVTKVRNPSATVAVADSMGTAATFAASLRQEYDNNGGNVMALGNEGFNLDPPRCDQGNGEMAGFPNERGGADPRHLKQANVLWVDAHADGQSLENLGYRFDPGGAVRFDGDNAKWSGKGQDVAWTPGYNLNG